MPTLHIIDSHVHIWDPRVQRMPWLDAVPAVNRPIGIDELEREFASIPGVHLDGAIYVEVDETDPEQEDRLLYENDSPLIIGRTLRSRVSPYMRIPVLATAIREPLHSNEIQRARIQDPLFLAGLEVLADRQLPFEVVNREEDLPAVLGLLEKVPQETVILNHMGNVSHLTRRGRYALQGLSELPNLYVKISGDNPIDLETAKFVSDVFSPRRIMFASNFPMVNVTGSLESHLRRVRSVFGDDPLVFSQNALRAYGVRVPALPAVKPAQRPRRKEQSCY